MLLEVIAVSYTHLADVVLMAAEAYNETGTDRQKAWDLLNSVRTRAEGNS